MIGIRYDLVGEEAIYQGADWYKEFQLINPSTQLPYNLTGYVITSQARKHHTDAQPSITFSCSVVSAINGIIGLALSNVNTSAISVGKYTYDVEAAEPSPSIVKHKPIIPSTVMVIGEYTK